MSRIFFLFFFLKKEKVWFVTKLTFGLWRWVIFPIHPESQVARCFLGERSEAVRCLGAFRSDAFVGFLFSVISDWDSMPSSQTPTVIRFSRLWEAADADLDSDWVCFLVSHGACWHFHCWSGGICGGSELNPHQSAEECFWSLTTRIVQLVFKKKTSLLCLFILHKRNSWSCCHLLARRRQARCSAFHLPLLEIQFFCYLRRFFLQLQLLLLHFNRPQTTIK